MAMEGQFGNNYWHMSQWLKQVNRLVNIMETSKYAATGSRPLFEALSFNAQVFLAKPNACSITMYLNRGHRDHEHLKVRH
jgi:hypothetical protein